MKFYAAARQVCIFFLFNSFIAIAYSQAPNQPVNPVPSHQAGSVSTNPDLCATVSDPNGGTLQVRYHGRKVPANGTEKFTVILLPDTQYYTEEPQGTGNVSMFNAQTAWIANKRQAMNIVYVGQLGDCSQNGDNPPGANDSIEWERVNAAISTIENPALTGLPHGIPYGLSVGNHDQTPNGGGNTATTIRYNQYFGVSRFNGRNYYGGHEGSNNDNHYDLFSASGIDFLVISMEYDTSPEADVLNWAANLVQTYSSRKVIVMTHFGINETGSPKPTFGAQGQAIYDKLKQYPNFMLFVCGHIHQSDGEARRMDIFNGNTVHTILSDYQGRPGGGNGLLRIMEFDPAQNKISVKTYSPYADIYETDADSQFELSVNMLPVIGQVNNVPSGTNRCFTWNNLLYDTGYEWDMELYDGQNVTLGPVWKFTTAGTDLIPPTVSSVTPVNGATGINTGTTVIANFSEAVNASTVTISTFQLKDAGNNIVAGTVSAASGQITLIPSSPLVLGTTYTATIIGGLPGISDVAGNALASDYSWSFTTADPDIIPPTVSSVTPVNGATGVSSSTTVSAIFNEVMDATTINSSTIELRNPSNTLIPATVSYNAGTKTVTLTASAALVGSTVYTAKIISGIPGVKDAAGNPLTNDYSWSFTTGAVISQPPVSIQSFTTRTGTAATAHSLTGVPAGALLVLATTSDAALSNCTVSSSPSLSWTKRADAGASNSDNAEIWTAVYSAGGAITVTSNWGAVSQASVCYIVLNAEPTLAGASGIAVSQSAPSVTITTTRANSIIFGCTADWKAVNGATRTLRDAATERLYFRDVNYTTYYYTKTAASIAAYTEGISLPTGQQACTALLELRSTTAVADLIPPTVSSVTPANGATGISVGTTVSAVFNEAMDATTINGSTIELRDASNTLITATVSYNTGTTTAIVIPSAALAGSTLYTAKIKSGTAGVKDVAGNALVSDYSWSFTTVVPDIIPPVVSSVTPANGATGVSVITTVSAIFNEAMDATTINSSTIELRDPSNTLITATVSYNAGTKTVTLTASAALAGSTVYTAKIISGIPGVKDAAGNPLASDYSWSFTTGAIISQPSVSIQSFTTRTGTAATAHSLTGVPAGALLVLATTSDAALSNCNVSSSPSLTWTKRADAGASNSDNAEIWTAVYSAGGAITVTSNWGAVSQASVCYVVLNAEPTLAGASGIASSQSAPSVTITTTRSNSIIFGCTADWNAVNGATRTLRDAATETFYYFKQNFFTNYFYTRTASSISSYTEGVSLPTGQQASTALLEIRSASTSPARFSNPPGTPVIATPPVTISKIYSLGQNYPNPFNNKTSIQFTVPKTGKVNLTLFDINGRVVKVLVNGSKDAGMHTVNFNAGSLAGGVYYYKMQAVDFTDVKKLIIR